MPFDVASPFIARSNADERPERQAPHPGLVLAGADRQAPEGAPVPLSARPMAEVRVDGGAHGVLVPQEARIRIVDPLSTSLSREESPALAAAGDTPATTRLVEASGSVGPSGPGAETARSVAMQLVAALRMDAEGGFDLQLSPEELGRVRLSLQVLDGVATLTIQAERPETLDLMRRHIDILERDLLGAGFASLNFTFGQGSSDSTRSRTAAQAYATPDSLEKSASGIEGPSRAGSARSQSLLDLRL